MLAGAPRPRLEVVLGPARSLQASGLSPGRRDQVLSQKVVKMEELTGKQERGQALHRGRQPTSAVLVLHPLPSSWAVSSQEHPHLGSQCTDL